MLNKFDIVNKYAEYALTTFTRLKAEYNLDDNVTFTVPSIREYIFDEYENRYVQNCDCIQSMMTEINCDYLLEESFICTKYDICKDNNTRYRIILPKYHISEILIDDTKEQDIKDYIEESIKHEIGHIFHIKEIIDNNDRAQAEDILWEEDHEFFTKYDEFLGLMDEGEDTLTEYQYQKAVVKKYYSMSPELDANNLGKVDVEKLIELELKVRIGLHE